MSGFKFKQRTAKLVFVDDEDYAGAEVRVQLDFPIGEFIILQKLQADPESIEELCKFLEGVLIDWNLEDDRGPIPATIEGIKRIPPIFIGRLCGELIKAMRPSVPLEAESPSGKLSEEPSTPPQESQ